MCKKLTCGRIDYSGTCNSGTCNSGLIATKLKLIEVNFNVYTNPIKQAF
jgi:hypothetical protein